MRTPGRRVLGGRREGQGRAQGREPHPARLTALRTALTFTAPPTEAHARVAHARRAASCAVMLLARRLRPQACGATLKPGFRSEALGGPPPR